MAKLRPWIFSKEFPQAHDSAPPVPIQAADHEGNINTELEVERILQKRKFGRTYKYYIKWLGFPDRNNTWEPKSGLTNAKRLLDAFELEYTDPDAWYPV